jgi:hypothetical protein
MGSAGKHQLNRKSKGMLALGGKKAGKGKGSLDELVYRIIESFLVEIIHSLKEYFMRSQ